MNDHNARYRRLRDTATGAVVALAAVGAIAGAAALAANPGADKHRQAATAKGCSTTKSPAPDKTRAPQPAVNQQPFLNAVQHLVDNGTITASEGRAVDREIQAGSVDTASLASSGFTPTQLEAVQRALGNAKRALAQSLR